MRLELAMARRLSLKAPGIPVAVAGIALSIAIMLLAIAIVSGFKRQIREKVTGFEHEITIYPETDYSTERVNNGIQLTDSFKDVLTAELPGSNISLEIRQPAIFKTDNDFEGIVIKGVDKNGNDFIGSQITGGEMPYWDGNFDSSYPVVISSTTASALSLAIGDAIMAHFFIGDNLLTRKLHVAAIYNTHFGEYDKTYAFAPIELLQKICKVDSLTGSAVSITDINDNPEEAANRLRIRLCEIKDGDSYPPLYRVVTINTSGAMYFNWLELLDTNVIVILILMGCVAGFTLISCLFIIVLERVRMIGLLKALGATDAMIRRLFIYMACRLVWRGLLAGNIFALLVLAAQSLWHIIPLDPDAYYLSYVPVNINWGSVIALDVAVVAVSFLLLVIPSHIISTLSPSETMRYE
ncbi:MAG: ABC transporter permease [Paramuribaculum sp.]|nr:ABC transporter permease [Paramuribaculum sp.]